MATRLSSRFLSSSRQHMLRPTRCIALQRPYSSEAAPPPLLVKLKDDLKGAMRAKDKERLSVLRSVISAVNNASKTNSPVKTDLQLLAILRKFSTFSQEAVADYRSAGRPELVEKEEAQIKILDEYIRASGLEILGEDEVRSIILETISEVRARDGNVNPGEVSKMLLAKGGKLHGKNLDVRRAAEIIKEETSK